jgi:fibronectin-binding autotransporter adhesin
MRSTSSLTVKWMSVSTILLAVFALVNLAAAQSGSAKRELSRQALQVQPVAARAQQAKRTAPPPTTTDTWTGGGGANNDWSDASNWNNGAITSGENILINLTSANTVDDQNFTIGTLTLSNSGDSVTLNNNVQTTVNGNISNAGTITLDGNGATTELYLGNSLSLSGSGSIVLTSTNNDWSGQLNGVADSTLTTSSNITGAGNVGEANLNLSNSGTINANVSGETLTIQPDTCSGCSSTNTGTLEATGGGTLELYNGTWTNTGGKISAATGSAVNLEDNVTINGGTLTTTGTGIIYGVGGYNVFLNGVTNSGAYELLNNNATEISGTITNTGTITLQGNGATTELYLSGNATLTGAGTVVLSSTNGDWSGYVDGVSGSILTNQSTIEGWGTVGNSQIQIANASNGVINSNISGGNINLDPLTTVTNTNAGLIEATNGGTVTFNNGAWTNTGGVIEAQAGSAINLEDNVSITGGTLESTGTGSVNNVAGYNVFLTGLTLAGTYNVQNNGATEISGTITNNGTINIIGAGATTGLYVSTAGSNSATLAGSGTVVLTTTNGDYSGYIYGDGGTLTIDQNISGAGNIGNADITLVNNSTINANLGPTITNAMLTIQPNSGGMTNTGTLEATTGGTLQLYAGSITNTGGTITAVGADSKGNASTVILDAGVSITGGTLTTSGAGVIEVTAGNQANITTLTNSGTLNVLNNGELNTNGTITNNGTITVTGNGASTYLYAPTNTTLTGTGTVVLTSTNGDYSGYLETASGATTTNAETIEGAGTIQDGTFVNNATVNANTNGETLTLYNFAAATNTKTMEASGGGTLAFDGSTWTNTGGTITAQTGSSVELYSSTSITGGTLSTAGTGQFYVPGGNQANLTTLTISTGSAFNVQNNGEVNTNGTITNNGTITVTGNGASTYLYAATNTTLTGTGAVVLSSTNNDYSGYVDAAGGVTLTNTETIEGAGTIENGIFANTGTVNANVSGETLTLYSLTTPTNSKTLEASNGGTLAFNGSSWTQTGAGTITAQTGSSVELYNNATITGGVLTTAGTGQFYTPAGNVSYLTNLTNEGTFNINNNAQTELTGTITNTGSFNLAGNGASTYLLINGAVTLKGGGIVDLGSSNNDYSNYIYGEGTTPTLTSYNTIEGSGNLGSGNMGFTNNGTVDANVAGGAISINVNSSGFTNYNGTTTTLTGGTYIANGGNINYNFGNTTGITTLSASVTEEGGGQFINTNNSTNALGNLTSITSTGALTTDVNFTDPGAFSNAGALTILGGTTFKVASLAQISGGSLTAGTYVLDSNLDITGAAQTITTNAANLTLAGGTIENTSNSTNALASLANNSGKLTIGGSTAFTTSASSFNNTGTLTINPGSTFIAPALTQISGTTLSGGTFVLGGNIDLNSGVSITTNSSTLTLEGGTINSGSTNALAGLDSNTKSLTLANSANFTTAGNFSNTGSLTVNGGSTFTVTGTLTQYHSATNTLQGGIWTVGGTLAGAFGANGIETDAANVTLDGTGTFKNTTAGSNANGLVNLNTIASTGSLTLASSANFTTAGNFTNSGKLTVDPGSTFTVTGTLTNLSSGTLTGGTYTVGGTLQLASSNGSIQTNAANLTLTGTTYKINDGSNNALSGFDVNSGSLTLSAAAKLTTASSTFTNSGTVNVGKGTTLTVGGTGNSYVQSAGTTNVDGTLVAGGTTGVNLIGGTIQGAGTIHSNTSNDATMSAGDAGKAGLLSITGTYTQLSSGTLNANIGGTTVGTLYSQLKISGTASLGGTLAVTLINSFTPQIGQTFTVLSATGGLGGTQFSNTTIAINSSEQFDISYTSTGVVLTVVSTTPSNSNKSGQPAEMAADSKQAASKNTSIGAKNNLLHAVGVRIAKRVEVASAGAESEGGKVILPDLAARSSAPRIWEHVPATPSWDHVQAVAVGSAPRAINLGEPSGPLQSGLAHRTGTWTGTSHAVPVQAPIAGWAVVNTHRAPLHMLPAMLPPVR